MAISTRCDYLEEAKIKRIKELIEEYADCRSEMDLQKVAVEIFDLSREDQVIAENMKDYWMHQRSGGER